MTVTYGLTSTGFTPKPMFQIRADINAALQGVFGASIDLGDTSVFGQTVGIFSESLSSLWLLAQQVNSSQDPDAATGASLDAVSALTGTDRPAATPSTTTLTLFGTAATVVDAGNVVNTESTGEGFATSVAATIAALTTWAGTTAYAVDDRVTNGGNAYQCITAGTSAGSGGPTTTAADITDGTVHWMFIGVGTAAVDVAAASVNTGPIAAVAGDLTVIATPVVGWTSVTNLADATKGRDVAEDPELRTLREEELSGDGQSPADAIRAALLKIAGVTSATVFVNDTDTTDTDGRPPHSVECLVRTTWLAGDPSDQLIFDAVFQNVAAGIASTGTTSGTSTDSQGTAHTVYFSRPTEVPIYIIVNAIVDPTAFPSDGAAEIQSAIATWGAAQAAGKDVVASAIAAQAFSVDGVLDVYSCLIGTAPSPSSSTTIAIDLTHIATYSTLNITVNVSNGTP